TGAFARNPMIRFRALPMRCGRTGSPTGSPRCRRPMPAMTRWSRGWPATAPWRKRVAGRRCPPMPPFPMVRAGRWSRSCASVWRWRTLRSARPARPSTNRCWRR
ncbi:hypothetical protein LTR94_036608, partial [Friedmanniomyces endolithicus]